MEFSGSSDMTASKSEKDWNAALELFHEKKSESLDDLVPVCEYNEEFMDFLQDSERRHSFTVINNLVMITHNTTKVHTFAQTWLSEVIRKAASEARLSPTISMGDYIVCCNRYTCGSIQEKYFDDGIYLQFDPTSIVDKNPEVVFEIAFTHEPFHVLFYECCHFLTSYVSDTIYSIGIHIRPSLTTFEIMFFVLQRTIPCCASDILHINNLYSAREADPNLCQSNTKKVSHPLTQSFCSKFFGVNLCYYRRLTWDDIVNGAVIRFRLDGLGIEQEVQLSDEILTGLHRQWDLWKSGRDGRRS
ncbi:hypothetical protein MDAP_001188 [Mitosporidium daphniae]